MKKHKLKFLAGLLAGTMIFSSLPADTNPFVASVSAAEEKLVAPANYKADKTDNSITLSWDAVSRADAYRIYKYNDYLSKYEHYKNVSGTKCKISGLYADTQYKFKVAALIKTGNKYIEQKSSTVKVKTEVTKLNAPINYQASSTETTITLSWDYIWGADAYRVYKYNESKSEYEQYKNVASNSCKITGLSTNTQYKFKVAALVKSGKKYIEQNSSTVKTKTTDYKLAAPTKITTSSTSSSIALSWEAVTGASAYAVYIQYPYKHYYELYGSVSGTTYNVTGLISDTSYNFKLVALVQRDDKYYEQTKTNGFAVKTKQVSSSTGSYAGGTTGGGYSSGGSSIPVGSKYVLNTNTLCIHEPSCRFVSQIYEENYVETDNFDWAIQHGYHTCAVCNPRKY